MYCNLPEHLVDVLEWCEQDSTQWPASVRTDCAFIHGRFEALKLDVGTSEAWRQAQSEWVRRAIRDAGLVRIVYKFRAR